jgi:hypothetical protein
MMRHNAIELDSTHVDSATISHPFTIRPILAHASRVRLDQVIHHHQHFPLLSLPLRRSTTTHRVERKGFVLAQRIRIDGGKCLRVLVIVIHCLRDEERKGSRGERGFCMQGAVRGSVRVA